MRRFGGLADACGAFAACGWEMTSWQASAIAKEQVRIPESNVAPVVAPTIWICSRHRHTLHCALITLPGQQDFVFCVSQHELTCGCVFEQQPPIIPTVLCGGQAPFVGEDLQQQGIADAGRTVTPTTQAQIISMNERFSITSC
jgi:hypothetical protein